MGDINVLFNHKYVTSDGTTVIYDWGVHFYSTRCVATQAQLAAVWNSLNWGDSLGTITEAIKPFFPVVRVPEFLLGSTPPEGANYDVIHNFADVSFTVNTDDLNSVYITKIVDDNGYGFSSRNGMVVTTPTGTYGPPLSSSANLVGMTNPIRDVYGNRAWGISFSFLTVDNQYGYMWLSGNKGNSGLYFANASASEAIYNWLNNIPEPETDPYSENGNTQHAGADGIGYSGIINDDIDFPEPPTASAANANFISIWTPTLDQVQDLAKWMWNTDPLKWNFWQKLLQNPLELIFSLSILPIPIHHTDDSGEPAEGELVALNDFLSLGWQDTGLKMDWVAEQYITLDMGSIELEEVWGAFLDYEPYTKIDIYLPYIGVKQLDTNDCMPRTISLQYIIDIATGTCLALIKCDNSVYYHFSGNCASQIPITVNQCQEIVRGLMTMVVGAATIGVGAAAMAGSGVTSALGIGADKGLKMALGGAATMGAGGMNAAKGVNVSRSGTISCAAGLMDVQTPYLIISRPRQAVPKKQNRYTGYPSFITEIIGSLIGYTEVQAIHLENIPCTDDEYREINELLIAGVII